MRVRLLFMNWEIQSAHQYLSLFPLKDTADAGEGMRDAAAVSEVAEAEADASASSLSVSLRNLKPDRILLRREACPESSWLAAALSSAVAELVCTTLDI